MPSSTVTDTALQEIVSLSNRVGRDEKLVQPGGGNTSIKVTASAGGTNETILLVKGSGTDLKSIRPTGFTRLRLSQLGELRGVDQMGDAEMMEFMATCMTNPGDPFPSVETPLHSILPYTVIVHTHDIATMSITNLDDAAAERLVRDLFEDEIVYVPYARPGFPLAQLASEIVDQIPDRAAGMTLAHHGLVVWGDDTETCHQRLQAMVEKVDRYIKSRRSTSFLGTSTTKEVGEEQRHRLAELLLPVIRGALTETDKVVLHFDDSEDIRKQLHDPNLPEVTGRGVATPEHVLRAGKTPVWIRLDFHDTDDTLVEETRRQIRQARTEYLAYHKRCADASQPPLDDWAKVVLVPGLGMVTAFKDKKSAKVANVCYRASLESMQNAQSLGGFQFLPEDKVFDFEYWPLERRKVDEAIEQERKGKLVPRQVVLVIGGAGGIGRAATARFLAEGANVVVADLDPEGVRTCTEEFEREYPQHVIGTTCDVTSEDDITASVRAAIMQFGGLDCLFYTAGAAPRFVDITKITRADVQRQIDIHYLGAVLAMRDAARVMARQDTGGTIVLSVSKAAVSAGRNALAYGSSKAALLQAMRVAAVELGKHNIRVNAINADQIDTPMFREFVRERARGRGVSEEEQIAAYKERNAMGVTFIPPSAVGDLAVLLASNRFRYTTGDVLTIDGGLPEAFPR